MPSIVLATLNAKYVHAALGLRYLLANMGDLEGQTVVQEFTIHQKPIEVVERLLAPQPRVVGLGVYIWNVTETTQVVALLKALAPQVKVVLGGPEVSYETEAQRICQLADHVVTGWGDVSFPKLCRALLHGPQPLMKVVVGEQPPLEQIQLPYAHYTDEDIKNRLLYVEASRGCPFKCEFCLSSLDKTAWAFDLDAFLAQLDGLIDRGARSFKFVDRTFNLKIETSARILQFFLAHIAALPSPDWFVHFEVVPDVLPDKLKALIVQFPPDVLQFEIGIQTFTSEVQSLISRRQDRAKTHANLRWLVQESPAHIHADLIFGLPSETLESFAASFDELLALGPHEVQLGLLKRLRGTPIIRHTAEHGMVYDPAPPYTAVQTGAVGFADMLRVTRMARYWEILANRGKFAHALPLLLAPFDSNQQALQPLRQPPPAEPAESDTAPATSGRFFAFLHFADWLWQRTGKTHEFAQDRMMDLIYDYCTQARGMAHDAVCTALAKNQRPHTTVPKRLETWLLAHPLPRKADK